MAPAPTSRYHVISELGRGAMGVVYRAHDMVLDREVALKELHLPQGLSQRAYEGAVARFYTEARAAARLSHPQIVTVHDVGESDDGGVFLTMEVLDGPTLGEVLGEVGALPTEQAEGVLLQVAEALAHAHAQGITHRDIKPDNCFWLPDGRVKVADFGIARVGDATHLTQAGTVMGTPGYMAPEQVRGQDATPAADVFAWGALAYECLSGRPPFGQGDPHAVMYRIVHEDPPDLLAVAPGTPPALAAVIARALAKDPAERYGDGRELMNDLMFSSHEAVISPPPAAVDVPEARLETSRGGRQRPRVHSKRTSSVSLFIILLGVVVVIGAISLLIAFALQGQ